MEHKFWNSTYNKLVYDKGGISNQWGKNGFSQQIMLRQIVHHLGEKHLKIKNIFKKSESLKIG